MKNLLLSGIIAGAFILGVLIMTVKPAPLGGVASVDAYTSTTTRSTSASATASYRACGNRAVFGSIVVNQPASAGWVRVWDATSTATSTYVLPSPFSSTTYAVAVGREIAQISSASDVVGTYTYDVATTYGVVVETAVGFDGQYTVTCKN